MTSDTITPIRIQAAGMKTPSQVDATVIVHDKSPAGRALIRQSVKGMVQFNPIVEEWLATPGMEFLCICLDGAVPVKAFSVGASNEADLYGRVLRDAANLMPIDALATSQIVGATRDLSLKCDLIWRIIVNERLASRGGSH